MPNPFAFDDFANSFEDDRQSDCGTDWASEAGLDDDGDEGDDLLVIGIDFGTTSSGVGWATASDFKSDHINIITTWRGNGREIGKVPTEIFYERGNTTWGFEIGKDCHPLRWFKLLLLKEENMPSGMKSSEYVLAARRQMEEEDKTPIDLIADYLRVLWAYILENVAKSVGEDVVEFSRIHIVITVPAIWRGYARQAMKDAAAKAGLLKKRDAGETRLSFVPEPEAAALSTLSEPGRKPKKDEVFMVCDCGGGTVDLITYKIRSTDPFSLEEAVEGSGGLCGGIFIDQAFQKKVKKCIGRKWGKLSDVDTNELMESWEYGPKHQFSISRDTSCAVTLPSSVFQHQSERNDDNCDPPIKEGRLMFNRQHIQDIFDGVLAEIDGLVDGQIAGARRNGLKVTGIILVGGLGSSPYLYEHLRGRYKSAKIGVLQSGGERPRVAICRGAVVSGFLQEQARNSGPQGIDTSAGVKVVSTIARASYGACFRTSFDQNLHSKQDKVWCANELQYFSHGHMEWYLRKGDNVTKATPMKHPFYRIFDLDWDGSFNVTILQCEDQTPPNKRNETVTELCTIQCKLAHPVSTLPDFVNQNGRKFKRFEYMIEMVPSGATVEFAVSLSSDGTKLGGSDAHIRFQ